MAAPAQSACGMGEENHIKISPATSNKDVEFTRDFDRVFTSSSLRAAFEDHPAFKAIFESNQERHGRAIFRGDHNEGNKPKKFPGQIVAVSTESATASAEAGLARASKGLISAIMTAYSTHCDLIVSPDDVWLTILAQFCAYVNKNAEGLRNRIVEHEGKEELVACSTPPADYPRMIKHLLGLIRKNIKSPELADWFRPGFSTTTERDEVCAAATAMASLQAYFEFTMCVTCGIPSVTLLGTVGDWKLLREKIERLLEFEVDGNPDGKVIEIWVGYLRRVCDGFVESAEHPGSPETLEFWDKVLSHISHGSGMRYTTGWVSAFTCFNSDGDFLGKRKAAGAEFPMIRDSEICHNVVSCPVKIIDGMTEFAGTLFSGQTVCEAERAGETGHPTVRPRNDWCLAVAVKE
eukprot:g18451.t1